MRNKSPDRPLSLNDERDRLSRELQASAREILRSVELQLGWLVGLVWSPAAAQLLRELDVTVAAIRGELRKIEQPEGHASAS